MKIVVLGAGYVGLTTSACLAALGHDLTCCDIDASRVEALNQGIIPIYEPGLSELITAQIGAGRLRFSISAADEVKTADAVFLAVGTPSDAQGNIDLSFVEAAAKGIAPHLKRDAVLEIKSTVVAGTAHRVKALVDDARKRSDIAVASNPEFLREGTAIKDFMHADRVVIGADDATSEALLRKIYRPLTDTGVPLVAAGTVDAELIKYAANALLALKIGFINDVADLCEAVGGDVGAVADGIGRDHRIGAAFLAAGPGFGGSCFPKDTRAFAGIGRQNGAPQPLIEALIDGNERRKRAMAKRIIDSAPARGRVAILGTSFKANTDDVREAAALTIIPLLVAAGLEVHAHDPQPSAARRILSDIAWHDEPLQAAEDADVTVIVTEWDEYRTIDLRRLADTMRGQMLIDLRNIIRASEAARAGLHYRGLGRPGASPKPRRRGQGVAPRLGVAASPA
jgi:UDPglucose 6-dehydrogenase